MNARVAKKPGRFGLYFPFIVVLMLLAVWTGWWFYLSDQVRARMHAQADQMRAQGWDIVYADTTLSGWPFRTRLAVDHVQITAPSGHAIAAPELVAQANAWQPTKWVVVASDGMVVTRAGKGKLAIRGVALRASASHLDQIWPNITFEMVQPVFTPLPDAELFPIQSAERIEFYLKPHRAALSDPTPGANDRLDMLVRLIDAKGRADGPVDGLARRGRLTLQFETVISDASALRNQDEGGMFAGWVRDGGQFRGLRGELSSGDARALLSSDVLSADPEGRLTGTIAVQAVRPLAALEGLAGRAAETVESENGARLIPEPAGPPLSTPVPVTPPATPAETDDKVQLLLEFRDGRTWLGPFALAAAPKLF